MATNSKIEWTEATWNPVNGCTPVSSGCLNCYAARDAQRMAGHPNPKIGPKYKGLAVIRDGRAVFTGEIRLREDRLADPLHWRTPRRVFVNSQSDLFHKDVPFEFVDRVFAVMAMCRPHTFQVLTKRPERMAEYLEWRGHEKAAELERRNCECRQCKIVRVIADWLQSRGTLETDAFMGPAMYLQNQWPLPNVWLGASVENQEAADERIPHLLRVPAAVRFLSCEPLLGPIDLKLKGDASRDWDGQSFPATSKRMQEHDARGKAIHWAIVGGESGSAARPCNIAWISSIRDQCRAAGVPCFVKQLGARPTFFDDGDGAGGRIYEFPLSPPDYQRITHPKGGDMAEWPDDLQVREMPEASNAK